MYLVVRYFTQYHERRVIKKCVSTWLLLTILGCTACSVNKKQPDHKNNLAVKSGKARIVFYRPYYSFASLISPTVLLNEKRKCKLRSDTHVVLHVDPGEYQAEIEWPNIFTRPAGAVSSMVIPLEAKEQHTYFLKYYITDKKSEFGGLVGLMPTTSYRASWAFEQVDLTTAKKEIVNTGWKKC